jgi:ligand-binding sensor domain-containing protein
MSLESLYQGKELTSFDLFGGKAWIGTQNGYMTLDLQTKTVAGPFQKLPVVDIRSVRAIGDKVWFGTSNGAFALRTDGKFDYYQGQRWMPGKVVSNIGVYRPLNFWTKWG